VLTSGMSMNRTVVLSVLCAGLFSACVIGESEVDNDGDGADAASDCNDHDASVYPGAADLLGDGADQNCDGVDGVDGDQDGEASVESGGTDCDDTDDTVYEGASELCDGEDNDCNGTDDDDYAVDALTFYEDGDGDDYGDPDSTTAACSTPDGYVDNHADCDDNDDDIHPGADEYCNGRDDDCNGTDDDDYALDAELWYADDDGDGYGDSSTSTTACDPPNNYTSDDDDCNDDAPYIHPSAEETAGDGIDSNCNGDDDT